MTATINYQPSTIQPLKGWLSTYYVNQNGRRFGPYHVRVWKQNGKTFKQYIKPSELQRVRKAVQAYKDLKQEGRRVVAEMNNQIGNLNWLYRMNKRLDKNRELRDEDWAFMDELKARGFTIAGRPCLRRSTTHDHRLTRRLMVPFFTKSVLKHFEKTMNSILDEMHRKQDPKEMWQKWRDEQKQQPPAPQPNIGQLPDWITEEEIDQIVQELANAIK